jgi:hypothetical protein
VSQPDNVTPEPEVVEVVELSDSVSTPMPGEAMGQVEMRESFDSLKEASDNLALNVEALNHTLQAVNALQIEQARQKEVQEQAEKDLETARIESEQRDARTRRTFTFVGLALAILLPLVSIIVYAALLKNVNDLLDDQKSGFYNTCLTRNQATVENIRREQQLAKFEDNAQLKAIHLQSAEELAKGKIDCSDYLK